MIVPKSRLPEQKTTLFWDNIAKLTEKGWIVFPLIPWQKIFGPVINIDLHNIMFHPNRVPWIYSCYSMNKWKSRSILLRSWTLIRCVKINIILNGFSKTATDHRSSTPYDTENSFPISYFVEIVEILFSQVNSIFEW